MQKSTETKAAAPATSPPPCQSTGRLEVAEAENCPRVAEGGSRVADRGPGGGTGAQRSGRSGG
eukprot:3390532-Alexandrium_andersonii.AAC.1